MILKDLLNIVEDLSGRGRMAGENFEETKNLQDLHKDLKAARISLQNATTDQQKKELLVQIDKILSNLQKVLK